MAYIYTSFELPYTRKSTGTDQSVISGEAERGFARSQHVFAEGKEEVASDGVHKHSSRTIARYDVLTIRMNQNGRAGV